MSESKLIPPHGGKLVDRMVPEADAQKLKDAAEKTLCVARVPVDSTPQAVQDHVLLLGCLLQITDKRLQL